MHRYRTGDELDLLALFNRVFAKNRSLEHWRWQFERNPYLPPTIIVARRDRDGFLGGSHVLMPIALAVNGQRVLAGHTLDLVIHEEFRRQRMFETTARECFVWARERGVQAVIAFPNAQSYPGFVRSLGWSRVLEPFRWDRRIGLRRALGASPLALGLAWVPDALCRAWWGHASVPPQYEVEQTSSAPADHDVLWTACAAGSAVTLWKDREYMAWRYDANPDHTFEYLSLRRRTSLDGVAVLWRSAGRMTICDLVNRPDSDAGPALVQAVVRHARELGDDRISFLGRDQGGFDRAFASFRKRVAPENVLVAAGLGEGELDTQVRDGAQWTVCFGDADYV